MNSIAEPKRLFSESQGSVSLPENPHDWNFTDYCNDKDKVHKFFESEEWSCPNCGKKEMQNPIWFGIMPNQLCESCIAVEKRKEIVPDEEANKMKEEVIPPLYRSTDISRLPFSEYRKVIDWKPTKSGKGLWIVGNTRTGKTRSLCLLIEQLIDRGSSVKSFFHGNFNDELIEVIRSEKSFRAWKRIITSAPILAIDDLFASKLTERVESSLFDILDERISWNRPTIVTTQVTKSEANNRFHSPQRHQAFFARIKEFFEIVPFVDPIQDKLKI